MRLVTPPRPVQVKERDGVLLAVAVGRGPEAVAGYAGPWRLAESWWAEAVPRDYFQVHTRPGRVYLLYQEGDAWYLQGVFD
jgi:protein ImuB